MICKIFKKSKAPSLEEHKFALMRAEDDRILKIKYNPKLDALLISHSIEKGMSLDKPRKHFGEDRARSLIEILKQIDENCFEYDVSMSILEEYLKMNFCDDKSVKKDFETLKDNHHFTYVPSGVDFVKYQKNNKQGINFEKFLQNRHDIRKTTNERIGEKDILKAIDIARLAPSACNRQPWKVYYSMDSQKNVELGKIVSGNKTFSDDMKYYCAIVLDHSLFANRADEFRQIYLNAGIFLSYFVLALHSLGIGSCIMQFTGFVDDADAKSRDILKIKNSEQVMAIIGYGKYPHKIKYSRASRRNVSEIAIKF